MTATPSLPGGDQDLQARLAQQNLRIAALTALVEEKYAGLDSGYLIDQVSKKLLANSAAQATATARAAQELARANADYQYFAYIFSHEIQEPLRISTSFAQLLRRSYSGKLDARADKFINYIVDGTAIMQAQLEELTRYVLLNTAEQAVEAVDSTTALQQALAMQHPAIAQSDAQISWDELPIVASYGDLLTQLFARLLDNAIKFRGPDAPVIHIAARREGETWLFAVRDNGIGIAPEYSERIFVLFRRLHTRSEYPGTGASLAICRRIVARHGGRIWVESQAGQGATFYFTLVGSGDGAVLTEGP